MACVVLKVPSVDRCNNGFHVLAQSYTISSPKGKITVVTGRPDPLLASITSGHIKESLAEMTHNGQRPPYSCRVRAMSTETLCRQVSPAPF
jgi:hypothetical protein